jgi:acyl-CoA reductase-like NAD-dependent aldehyde dehydrogenase
MATAPAQTADTDTGTITILNPADGTHVGTLASASPEPARHAVGRARLAEPGWAGTPAADRGALLHAAAAALEGAAQELAELNRRETGKPLPDALGGVQAGAATLRQYAELGPLHRGHSLRGAPLAMDYTVSVPRGVAVLLTPWNDPVAVAAGLIGAALATGNTVVHKPSERCPHVGERLGELLAAVFPPGIFTTVTGGPEAGQALAESPDADVVAHVGSTATGQRLARLAGLTAAHVIRENGGNDPLIVDAGVDPRWAAEQAALGAFANCGQICTSVERIYVHRDIAADFCRELTAQARALNASGTFPPLVDTRMRDGVHDQVGDALARGAMAAEGGFLPDAPGAHYPATVLLDCAPTLRIMQEETFGPVAPVAVAAGFDEALEAAAAGRYGLAATVLTADLAHAQRAIHALPVGTVKVNNVFGGAPGGSAQPRGASGDGFGYGPELLDEFTQVKVVHVAEPRQGRP